MITALGRAGTALTDEQRERYARPMLLDGMGEEGQRRLLGTSVLVIGAGGLGSPVLMYLAGAGIGHIGIVDSDVLDTSNLHRQVIHSMSELGQAKTDSAARRIADLNPDVDVTCYHLRLTAENVDDLFEPFDIIVDATDNFATRYLIDAAATRLGKPEVWGSVLGAAGQVSTFWSGPAARTAGVPVEDRLTDLYACAPREDVVPEGASSPVIGPITGMVGSLMVGEVTKLAAGYGQLLLGRVAFIDTAAGQLRDMTFKRRTSTRISGHPE